MTMTNSIRGAVVVAIVVGTCQVGQSQQSPKTSPKQAGNDAVHTIVLPQYSPEIPAGPHVNTYRKDCLVCHSARYVAMQPRFPQAVWEKEVKKMVDAYGAQIPDAEQKEIVEYLVVVRGPSESK
jgi:cytochrome c5